MSDPLAGKFIVFEGGEGSGKTTQLQQLQHWLLQHDTFQKLMDAGAIAGIRTTREPGGTPLGKQIRHLLLNSHETPIASRAELLLYAADRAQHVEETLKPWLAQGYWVLCDRYTDSTVAYQGYGRQLDFELIETLNKIATQKLKSDLTLWLNLPLEVGLNRMRQRAAADRIEQASLDFHQRVSEGFTALAQQVPGAVPSCSGPAMVKIDGDRSIEAVAEHIQQVIQSQLLQWYPQHL